MMLCRVWTRHAKTFSRMKSRPTDRPLKKNYCVLNDVRMCCNIVHCNVTYPTLVSTYVRNTERTEWKTARYVHMCCRYDDVLLCK